MAGNVVGVCMIQPQPQSTTPFFFCDQTLGLEEYCLGQGCDDPRFEPLRLAGRAFPAPPEVIWREDTGGFPCDDIGDVVTGACCFETVHHRADGTPWEGPDDRMIPRTMCRQVAESVCRSGVMRLLSGTFDGPVRFCYVGVSFFEFYGNVDYGPTILGQPNVTDEYLPLTSTRIRQTFYHGDHTLCSCTSRTEPFILPRLQEAGFNACLLLPQDERSWEDVCQIEPPDDEFDCRTLGMPLVIDEDGFAAFDAGNRRVDSGVEGCTQVFADLHIDSNGMARAIACTKFDDEGNTTDFALADLFQDQCAAMYGEYRWNQEFAC